MIPVALTIAGSDPSGGAGLQADLKTFQQHGVFGTGVLTLLTVQNTRGVDGVLVLEPDFVRRQVEAVLSDLPPRAAKTGALGSAAVIGEVARLARNFSFPLVVDPVMISKHGAPLMGTDAVRILVERLFPLAALVTPNLHEASELAGFPVTDRKSMEKALPIIAGMGPKTVLIKGGRLEQEGLDLLWSEGTVTAYTAPHIETPNTHGTGCVFSAAITARLARGENLAAAVHGAKQFIAEAIRTNPGLGTGRGPVNFHAPVPAVPEPRA